MGLGRQITFHGLIEDHNDVLGLMKKSKIFASASEREGYGIAIREAIHSGMFVVMNNEPHNAAKEAVTSQAQGVILDGNMAKNFAEAIQNALSKPEKRGDSRIQEYSSLSVFYHELWMGLVL